MCCYKVLFLFYFDVLWQRYSCANISFVVKKIKNLLKICFGMIYIEVVCIWNKYVATFFSSVFGVHCRCCSFCIWSLKMIELKKISWFLHFLLPVFYSCVDHFLKCVEWEKMKIREWWERQYMRIHLYIYSN